MFKESPYCLSKHQQNISCNPFDSEKLLIQGPDSMKTVDYKQQIISKPVDNYARKDWAGKYKISEKRHLDDTLQKLSFLYFLIALQQQACSILVGG